MNNPMQSDILVQNEWGSVPESKESLGNTPKWHDFKMKIDNWYNNVKSKCEFSVIFFNHI